MQRTDQEMHEANIGRIVAGMEEMEDHDQDRITLELTREQAAMVLTVAEVEAGRAHRLAEHSRIGGYRNVARENASDWDAIAAQLKEQDAGEGE